jgi:hypothetical protein
MRGDMPGPDPITVWQLGTSGLSTIALTDPPQIGQTDPVIGTGARAPLGVNAIRANCKTVIRRFESGPHLRK